MSTLRERIEAFADELDQDDEVAGAMTSGGQVAHVLRDILAEPEQHRFNRAAMQLADMAYMEADGTTSDKVRHAILGYLFAINSRQRFGDGWIYPSLDAMREHFRALREQAARPVVRQVAHSWQPGDPCGNCGSTQTAWSADQTEGAVCLSCGARDSDE